MTRPDKYASAFAQAMPHAENRVRAAAEGAWFAVAAALFIASELALLRAGAILARPLWLDEVHTLLLSETLPFGTSMRALAAGADFNPPTVFVLYRFVGKVAGALSPPVMRLVAVLSALGALTAVYVLLREHFSRVAASVGVLAVWAQSVVVSAAFDARFYAPWLFASGWLLVALSRAVRAERRSYITTFWLVVASIGVCTVHYFGTLSWAAAFATALVQGRELGNRFRRLAPALAGPVATLACLPLYLGQRDALSAATWIPAISVAGVFLLLFIILLPVPTIAALLSWGAAAFGRRRAGPGRADSGLRLSLGPLLLVTQAAVPLVLALLSLIAQPATQPRYWIVGSYLAAVIVAVAISRVGPVLASAVALVTLMWSVETVRAERELAEAHTRRVSEDASFVAGLDAGVLVVARRRHTLYPLLMRYPERRTNLALLDASGRDPDDDFMAVERDVARVHRRWFGFPEIRTPTELDTVPAFLFIEPDSLRHPELTEFPHHEVTRIAPRAYSLRRW